jgi:hypothetical protein
MHITESNKPFVSPLVATLVALLGESRYIRHCRHQTMRDPVHVLYFMQDPLLLLRSCLIRQSISTAQRLTPWDELFNWFILEDNCGREIQNFAADVFLVKSCLKLD